MKSTHKAEDETRGKKMSTALNDAFKTLDDTAEELVRVRNRPVLLLYYDLTDGFMADSDVEDLYDEFRRRGWSRDTPRDKLDVLFHTWGGSPDAAYRIAQLLRDFANDVDFLVPEHATSGGTLTCLSGNEIRMGAYATLGPIDLTVDDIEVASIDHFKRFAVDCCEAVVDMLGNQDAQWSTQVESALLVEMVKQVQAINIGSFYRQRDLTAHYAKRLMLDYMFSHLPNKDSLAESISAQLLSGFPSHDFALDFHMAKEMQLPVVEMDESESELTKSIVENLDGLVERRVICRDIGKIEDSNYKAPFVRLYEIGSGGMGKES